MAENFQTYQNFNESVEDHSKSLHGLYIILKRYSNMFDVNELHIV